MPKAQPYPQEDLEALERVIRMLVERRDETASLPEKMILSLALIHMRDTYEPAGGIIETVDPFGWGVTARPRAPRPDQAAPGRT